MGADERVVGHSEVLSKRYVELNTHGKAHSLEELEKAPVWGLKRWSWAGFGEQV